MTLLIKLCCFLIIVFSAELVNAQEQSCYGSGSIATSVVLTFLLTVLLLAAVFYVWQKFRGKKGGYFNNSIY